MKKLSLLLTILFFQLSVFACSCKKIPGVDTYDFIAQVKITEILETALTKDEPAGNKLAYLIKFETIQHFQGSKVDSILVDGANPALDIGWTSCDLGINIGEEWLLFANYFKDAVYRTNYCTMTIRHKNIDGERNHFTNKANNTLRDIQTKFSKKETAPIPDGKRQTFYDNNQIEIEENYKDGQLDGERFVYYSDGQIMIAECYENGQRTDKMKWWNKDGNLRKDYNYKNGHQIDTCYIYEYNGNVKLQTIHDKEGTFLSSKHYAFNGYLKEEKIFDPSTKLNKRTTYYSNGQKKTFTIRTEKHKTRLYQTWTEDGTMKIHRKYDENGEVEYLIKEE